jgi:hypothetical protein
VNGKFRGRWEFTPHCLPSWPSHVSPQAGFSGHTIGATAATRTGMTFQAIDGTTGGVEGG